MSKIWAASLPEDRDQHPLQEFPAPVLAKARHVKENASTSSVITLTEDTTSLEVYAGTTPAYLRWIATSDTQASVISTNWHHVIPKDQLRRFAVPRESTADGSSASVQGANRQEGLYRRVAYMSMGVGSVITAEMGQS